MDDVPRANAGAVEVPESLLYTIQEGLASVRLSSSSWSIFTVPNKLRAVNSDAYTPHVLSIGPFHYDRRKLAGMQSHKWRYTQSLLARTEDVGPTTESCLNAILGFESEVRSCYAEEIHLNSSDLAQLLFLDGCFILELFLRYSKIEPNLKNGDLKNDPIFTTSWIISTLQRDMALLENQIPFFVLEWLFDYTVRRSSSGLLSVPLTDIALNFFAATVSGSLMRTPAATNTRVNSNSILMSRRQSTKHLLDLIHISYSPLGEIGGESSSSPEFVPSIEELYAAGIKIKMKEATSSMFDLEYNRGVLEIPQLRIVDSTEALLRNMVAFEQCFHGCQQYVTSYAVLMNQLVYTTRDVELLEHSCIVENYLGSRGDVPLLFDNICKQIGLKEFYFARLCSELNRSYDRPWTQWMVALKRDYFTSPWTLVSMLAVSLLLVMTVVQTFYTVFTYYSPNN
ncbi:UPF0481 protein At3g47200 [Linum grandiflorum]